MLPKNSISELKFSKDLPQERGRKAEIAMSVLVAVLLICAIVVECYFNPETSVGSGSLYVGVVFFGLLLLFCAGQFFLRICYCFEEMMHIRSRYEKSFCQLLKDVFSCNVKTYILGTAALFCVTIPCLLWYGTHFKLEYLGGVSMIPILLAAYCIVHLMKMNESPHHVMRQLKELGGLDCGSGMAYSFYYGYLSFMLPDRGDRNMGLREKIELYCNKEKLSSANFPVKKLFVLIPASGHITASLTGMDDKNWLDESKCLEEEIKNVAGVMNRSYKNSLYKLRDPNPNSGNNEVYYFVAEGATPVKTYHNAMNNDPNKGSYFTKYQKEVTLRFYTTLVGIIASDKDCCNLCEIIYYKDIDDHGHKVSVSDVLLERIKEMKNRNCTSIEIADENVSGNMRLLDSPST